MIDDTPGTILSGTQHDAFAARGAAYARDEVYGPTTRRAYGTPETIFSWLAFGAVVVGAIGALVGAVGSSRQRRRLTWHAPGDAYEVTPPHGDKLPRL